MEQCEVGVGGKSGRILAVSSKFDGFKRETLYEVRAQGVTPNRAIGSMKKAWMRCDYVHSLASEYSKMRRQIKDLKYSAKDIEAFSLELVAFQNEVGFIWKSGIFPSALINNCDESSFVIHTDILVQPVDYIGYRNTKDITVKGNANHCLGCRMKNGTITVRGNAGSFVGDEMKGGVIIVEGNTGSHAGSRMVGGEIHIFGNHMPVISSSFITGKIFFNEELVAYK